MILRINVSNIVYDRKILLTRKNTHKKIKKDHKLIFQVCKNIPCIFPVFQVPKLFPVFSLFSRWAGTL
jgi:hypothetical protein